MSYTSWSVSFGEQPAASKWNILGTNDAEFNSLIQRSGSGVVILDSSGNESLKLSSTAAAVNEVTISNVATGSGPTISTTGANTNIDLNFDIKGSGQLKGVVDNLYNPYKFSAYASATVSITANVWTKATLNTEEFDTGSVFDNATNYRFTAPITGFYHIDAHIGVASAGISTGYAEGAIYVNGVARVNSLRIIGSGDSKTTPRLAMSRLLSLTAGDYVELYGFCSESTRNIAGGQTVTYMSGHLVSIG